MKLELKTDRFICNFQFLGKFLQKILQENPELKGGGYRIKSQDFILFPPFKFRIFLQDCLQEFSQNLPGSYPVARCSFHIQVRETGGWRFPCTGRGPVLLATGRQTSNFLETIKKQKKPMNRFTKKTKKKNNKLENIFSQLGFSYFSPSGLWIGRFWTSNSDST